MCVSVGIVAKQVMIKKIVSRVHTNAQKMLLRYRENYKKGSFLSFSLLSM
jgi:hypothetical protein